MFFDRRGDGAKILQWDGNGSGLHAKRLDLLSRERLQLSCDGARRIEMGRAGFMPPVGNGSREGTSDDQEG